jgi:hypothetical protein
MFAASAGTASSPVSVEAALIAAAAVLLTAVAAFVASILTTRITTRASVDNIRATIEAERHYRLWERRAEAYAEALGDALQRRQVVESMRLGTTADEQTVLKTWQTYNQDSASVAVEARLLAYCSAKVHAIHADVRAAETEFVNAVAACVRTVQREKAGSLDHRTQEPISTADVVAALSAVKAPTTTLSMPMLGKSRRFEMSCRADQSRVRPNEADRRLTPAPASNPYPSAIGTLRPRSMRR